MIRTGSGTFVSMPTTKPVSQALGRLLLHNSGEYSVSQFYEVRRMLEPECAKLAADRATTGDIQKIEQSLKRMEENQTDSIAWSNADLDFHIAVAETAHNPVVLSIIKPLTDSFRKVIKAGYMDPQGTLAGLEAHHQILQSIKGKDPALAHKSMFEHLTDSQIRLNKLGFK
jgi:GntR family transcriptional repressor for pyruvate dehydrogenase complex